MGKGNERVNGAFLKGRTVLRFVTTIFLWFGIFVPLLSSLLIQSAYAITSTWLAMPVNNDWHNGANWDNGIPNDTAAFGLSTLRAPTVSQETFLNQIVFGSGANPFFINVTASSLNLVRAGVSNSSGVEQRFVIGIGGLLSFSGDTLTPCTSDNSTIVNQGRLAFRNASAGSSEIVNLSLNEPFIEAIINMQFRESATAGTSRITNTGGIRFSDASTAGSSLITNNGRIDFNSTASSEGARVTNNTGATINLFQNTTLGSLSGAGNVNLGTSNLTIGALNTSDTISGVISGVSGSLTKVGTGNLTLTGVNSFGGGIINSAGTLTGNAASLNTPILQNNASLVFNQPSEGTFPGNMTGVGFLKTGHGTLTITGNSSALTGTTTIAEGDIVFTQSPPLNIVLGTSTCNILFNALTDTSQITYDGTITGEGGIEMVGPGTTTFMRTVPVSGTTLVSQGTFILNGTLPNSPVIVEKGAILRGTGRMKSLALGGKIFPGNSIGTLTVEEGFTMTPTSLYNVEVSGNGTSSLVAVGGEAQLGGTLNVLNTTPVVPPIRNQSFTILTATGGVNGQFSSLTGLPYTVQYLPQAVTILITPVYANAFSPTNNSNPARTARYFDSFADAAPPTSDLGGIIKILDELLLTGDTAGLTNAFNQIQPSQYREMGMLSFLNSELVSKTVQTQQQYLRETHRLETELKQLEGVTSKRVAGFQKLVNDTLSKGFNFANTRSNTIGPKRTALAFLAPHGAEGSGMPGNQRVRFGDSSAWFQSYGQVHEKNSSHGNKGLRSRTGGITMGADHQILKNTFVGLFGGLSTSPFNWKCGRGSGRMKSYYGGLYGTWMCPTGLYVDGQIIAGQDRFHSTRKIQFASINRKAKQSHHGNQFSVDTEVGYAYGLPYMTVQPYIDASYMFVRENGFKERGANSLNFKIKSKTSQFVRGAIGAQFYRTFVTCDTLIRPALQLAYVHKQPLGHHEAIKGGLVNEPQTLSVLGDNKKRNQFAPGASLTAQFANGVYIIANVNGEVFSGQNAGEAVVKVGYDF